MNNWNRYRDKRSDDLPQSATKPGPGDFEFGSVECRAAARALIQGQAEDELVIFSVYPDGRSEPGEITRLPKV